MSQTEATNMGVAIEQGKARAAARGAQKTPVKTQAPARQQGARPQQDRSLITFDTARRLCPTDGVAEKITRFYGLQEVDYNGLRERTEEQIGLTVQALRPAINAQPGERGEKGLEIHLQRIVGAYVGSAYSAGLLYDNKAAEARRLSSAVSNDDRDGDRLGIDGGHDNRDYDTANRAERACIFAAEMGLQAHALLAAAEGAVDAYYAAFAKDWKPYEGNNNNAPAVREQALAVRASAFDE